MAQRSEAVAKLVVRIRDFGTETLLFTRKRATGTPKHGHLEFLGGGIGDGSPVEGLMRELREEEKSGLLARKVATQNPEPKALSIAGVTHYMFEISISLEDYLELRHGRAESLGFKAVPAAKLRDERVWRRVTPKTQEIVTALNLGR